MATSLTVPQPHLSEDYTTHDINGQLLKSIVVPRPIAFITSKGRDGTINGAPFSFFNAVSTDPPLISLAIGRRKEGKQKDTSRNIILNQEFVINVCSYELAEAITVASGPFPPETSEIEQAKLSLIPSTKISVPRVANTLIQMECVLYQHLEIGRQPADLILGEIVEVHVHKKIIDQKGYIDIEKLNPLARLAGVSYATLHDFFEIPMTLGKQS